MTRSRWHGESGRRRALRVVGDTAAAIASFTTAFWVRVHVPLPFTRHLLPDDRLALHGGEWVPVAIAQCATLYLFALYDRQRPRSLGETSRRLASAVLLQGALLISYLFLTFRTFPRSVLLLYVLIDFLLLLGWRLVVDRADRGRARRVAIVGCGQAAREIAATLGSYRWHGLAVEGYVPMPGEPAPEAAPPAALGPCLGAAEDLPRLLASGRIDDIILAGSGDSWQTRLIDSLAGTRPDHTNVLLLPGPFESLIGRMRYRWVHDLPLIEVVRESEWRINWPAKRLLDLVAGATLFTAALPVLAACSLAVRLTSPGPILYRQQRIGRGQRPFTLRKLRTMRVDAEADSGEVLAQHGDPRLTPIGALLRRLRLDEIPQLINVLEGTMSMVGPRPERPGFVARYLREVPGYAERFSLAPGLTGLAQINGEYHSSAENKLRYDLAYAANWSLWLDVSILLRTIKIVLTSRGV
jgi:exopolysaccharide biosynthesis polyprenyl glycosylphosphotransferase